MSTSKETKKAQESIDLNNTNPEILEELDEVCETGDNAEVCDAKKEKRNNILYIVIGVLFAIAVIISLLWRTNIIQEKSKAVTIDGEKYTNAQVTYYYKNAYSAFLSNYYNVLSYLGVDTSLSMITQNINETAAVVLGVEEGTSWHDYFVDLGIKQMTSVQNGLKAAEAEGFVYPDSVQDEFDSTKDLVESSAAGSGMPVSEYLKKVYGKCITEQTYETELMRTLQYEAYLRDYSNNLNYSLEELQAAYDAEPIQYDRVSYSALTVYAQIESKVDADGNAIDPTEEDIAAAMEEAKKTAEVIQEKFNNGTTMRIIAGDYDNLNYDGDNNIAYSGDAVTTWLFDDARKPGDCEILEGNGSYTVIGFHERFREEYNTVNIRHVLFQEPLGTLTSDQEGYQEERDRLDAETEAKALAVLDEWLAGEATEESFAELAAKYSEDSSKYKGGLLSRVYAEQMAMVIDLWCFDENRKPGDTDIMESPYGYHVMYFVGEDIPRWQALVTEALAYEDYAAYAEQLSAGSSIQRNNLAMKLIGQ